MVYSQRVLVIVFVMAIQLFYVRSFSILTRPSLRRSPQCIYSRLFSVKRVVFLGTPEVAASTLKTLHSNGSDLFDIVAVVTQPPKRRKRKGAIEHSPVGKMAQELNIPLLVPESAKDGDFLDTIEQKVRPDLCITAAYGQYLPKRFVAAPQLGTVNIHPRYDMRSNEQESITITNLTFHTHSSHILCRQFTTPMARRESCSTVLAGR
jgi:hypothetical protein